MPVAVDGRRRLQPEERKRLLLTNAVAKLPPTLPAPKISTFIVCKLNLFLVKRKT